MPKRWYSNLWQVWDWVKAIILGVSPSIRSYKGGIWLAKEEPGLQKKNLAYKGRRLKALYLEEEVRYISTRMLSCLQFGCRYYHECKSSADVIMSASWDWFIKLAWLYDITIFFLLKRKLCWAYIYCRGYKKIFSRVEVYLIWWKSVWWKRVQ